MLGAVHRRLAWVALCLTACSTGPDAIVGPPRPDVPVVRRLAAGSRLHTEVAAGHPDQPTLRAAATWWREALRQSVRFEIADGQPPRGAPTLMLAIDAAGRRLSVFYRAADGVEQPLAGASYADDDLAAGIDRIAWGARLALGEDAAAPVPVAAAVSPNARAVDAAADAFLLLRDGGVEGARRALLSARSADGGSPFILDGLAAVALLRGDPTAAERLGLEALGYERRLAPTTRHRLARTLLLARASLRPDHAPERDRELLALGNASLRERPCDPQGLLSVAIAENLLGDFAAARPRLEDLKRRLPDTAIVDYHLGWACLGTDDATAALSAFDDAGVRLPQTWVVIPRAIAYYTAGDHSGLARMLSRQLTSLGPRDFGLVHELRRMQAAHALLQHDREAAAGHILADLNWLLANPSLLDQRPGQLAEQGEVLVRLGYGNDLPPIIAAIQGQRPATAVADTCAYLSGMVQIGQRRERDTALEGRLSRGGESVFALRLQAYGHEIRGELADMHATLARAARLGDSPLTKALLARSLRTMGRNAEALALRDALRGELTRIDLRRRPSHPLLGPELAFAFLID